MRLLVPFRFAVPFMLCWLARFAPAQPACRTIEGDRIQAKDLAAVLPFLNRLPGETWLANAPAPGSQRIFHSAELLSLAQRYSIDLQAPPDICFELAMEPLDRSRALEAMRSSLDIPAAQIEIAETILHPVPHGRIEFPRDRLGTPASAEQKSPVLWRGDVIYGENHRYAIWARVNITVHCRKAVAVQNLKPGKPVAAAQMRVEEAECFPSTSREVLPEQLAGMEPLRPIAAGAEIHAEQLVAPNDVNRGDLVEVEVRSGAARLVFTGKAETAGRVGDAIAIRNLDSNKIFQARVNGKGRAAIDAGSTKAD
jgi:flagella basal body P-ring formation protein FlgA